MTFPRHVAPVIVAMNFGMATGADWAGLQHLLRASATDFKSAVRNLVYRHPSPRQPISLVCRTLWDRKRWRARWSAA